MPQGGRPPRRRARRAPTHEKRVPQESAFVARCKHTRKSLCGRKVQLPLSTALSRQLSNAEMWRSRRRRACVSALISFRSRGARLPLRVGRGLGGAGRENAVPPGGVPRRHDAPGRPGAPSPPACPPFAGRSAPAGPRPSDGRRAGAGHLGYGGRGAVRMSWRPLAGGGWAPKLSAGERGG